jgi:hypothetical protein
LNRSRRLEFSFNKLLEVLQDDRMREELVYEERLKISKNEKFKIFISNFDPNS